jgi:hypothetical protein
MYSFQVKNDTITQLKTVAIHQPNYMPWLGYFYKIWASDMFVLHDNVQYTKQSFTKRVLIRKSPISMDTTYLSVPLKKHSDYSKICDLEICHNHHWQVKHIHKIYNTYHKAPFFNMYFPLIENALIESRNQIYLKELNEILIRCMLKILKCQTLLFSSSELPIKNLKADVYNAAIVSYLGGDVYISGQGAKKYQSENVYLDSDITLIYNKLGLFSKQAPPQYPVPFLMQVSILDALFYIGGEGILALFSKCQSKAKISFDRIYCGSTDF